MTDNDKRNREILKLLDTKLFTYGVIADKLKTTIGVVSGVQFRRRHPYRHRIASPAGKGGNKTGCGWQPATYIPLKTTVNMR